MLGDGGWVDGWMGILFVEAGCLARQVRAQTSSIGVEVFAFATLEFD